MSAEMLTIKYTFDVALLPAGFQSLARHVGFVSFEPTGDDEKDTATGMAVVLGWLTAVRERATPEQFEQVIEALWAEALHWTASAFDVMRINVEHERAAAGGPTAEHGQTNARGGDHV